MKKSKKNLSKSDKNTFDFIETEQLISSLYESTPPILILLDHNKEVLNINQEGLEFAHLKDEAIFNARIGKVLNCIHNIDNPAGCGSHPNCYKCLINNTVNKTFENNRGYSKIEVNMPISVDGVIENHHLLVSTIKLRPETEDLVFIVIENITKKLYTKDQIIQKDQEHKVELNALFNNMSSGFAYHKVIFDKNNKPIDTQFIQVNKAFETITEIKTEGLIGQLASQNLPGSEADFEEWVKIYANVAITRKPITFKMHAKAIDKWFSVNAYSPKEGYFVSLFQDITDQAKTEQELKLKNEEYLSLNEEYIQINQKLQNTNHELTVSLKEIDDKNLELNSRNDALLDATVSVEDYARKMNTLIGNLQGVVYRCVNEKQWTMEYLSHGTVELTGYEIEEIINNELINFEAIIHPEYRNPVWMNVQRALKKKTPFSLIYKIVCRNGSEKWVLDQGIGIFKNNKVICVEGYITDITVQKEAELALSAAKSKVEESEERYRSLYENSTIGLYKTKPNGEIILANPTIVKMLGYSSIDEMRSIGLDKGSYFNPKDRAEFKNIIEKENLVKDYETVWLKQDGTNINVRENAIAIRDDKNEIIFYEGTIEDITIHIKAKERLQIRNEEIKKKNQELIVAKEKAEESDTLKSAFLSNMSHEIRTPLNAILGFSQLLKDDKISEEQKSYIEIIKKSGEQLTNIITDILDISKIETNQVKITRKRTNLKSLFKEIYQTFSIKALDRNFKFNPPSILQDQDIKDIYIDSVRVHQIISNLLNNAFKFTQEGEINFGYEIKNQQLNLFVKDTGIGIEKSELTNIFDRFAQTKRGSNPKFGGTGIGLSICKGLVELMHGKIWAESTFNQGSSFYISMPLETPIEDHITRLTHKEEKPKAFNGNILIAEDVMLNFMLIKRMLKPTGFKIIHAKNGQEAVDLCNDKIDLVLMDIRMPIMDGLEASKIIRKTYSDLPIIAQTAFTQEDIKQSTLDAGCNDYLTKPINADILIATINKYLKI